MLSFHRLRIHKITLSGPRPETVVLGDFALCHGQSSRTPSLKPLPAGFCIFSSIALDRQKIRLLVNTNNFVIQIILQRLFSPPSIGLYYTDRLMFNLSFLFLYLFLRSRKWTAGEYVTDSWGYCVILISRDWILRLFPCFGGR